ncbi:hypothetical protein C8R47DRAFT_1200159 [Mycena vitilis]|nr:hypothetical protein C8R47DRAFT_1200159 [Mycena vitilis]
MTMSAFPSNLKSTHPRKRARNAVQNGTSGTATAVMASDAAAQRMPDELLVTIFKGSMPPDQFLRPRGSHRDMHSWRASTASKRALLSVCTRWQGVGTSFLYNDIAIGDDYTLWALCQTLRNKPALRELVRGLTIHIDVTHHSKKSRECITAILAWCVKLRRVDFLPYGGRRPFSLESQGIFPVLPGTVTSLELGYGIIIANGSTLLQQTCTNLRELRIDLDADANVLAAALDFPQLHTLQFTHTGEGPMPSMPHLTMPKLRSVTFGGTGLGEHCHASAYAFHESFLAMHGRKLSYLAFPESRGSVWDYYYDALLLECPVLQHVVLPSHVQFRNIKVYRSIKLVDVWCPSYTVWSFHESAAQLARLAQAFDFNVTRVRSLDVSLLNAILDVPLAVDIVQPLVLHDGPELFPPAHEVPREWMDIVVDYDAHDDKTQLVELRRPGITHVCDLSRYQRCYLSLYQKSPQAAHDYRMDGPRLIKRYNAMPVAVETDDEDDEDENHPCNVLKNAPPLDGAFWDDNAGSVPVDADISDPSTHSDDGNDSDEDSDADTEPNADADADTANPIFPRLRPGLRRFLQATVPEAPQRVFKRLGRAVAGMIFELPEA